MKPAWILVAAVIVILGYIRLVPSDLTRWHIDPLTAADPRPGGVLWRHETDLPGDAIARFDAIALSQPRTRILTGSVERGHVTYITRSKWFGFPDYITVKAARDDLVILSRARFGWGDFGVNKARLRGWLKRLEPVDN